MKKLLLFLTVMFLTLHAYCAWSPGADVINLDQYSVMRASAGVSLVPESSFCLLDSTGGNMAMTAMPVISTVNINAGMFIIVTSTAQAITISSATITSSRLRTPTIITTIRAGDFCSFLFDGSYWNLISSSTSGGIYP